MGLRAYQNAILHLDGDAVFLVSYGSGFGFNNGHIGGGDGGIVHVRVILDTLCSDSGLKVGKRKRFYKVPLKQILFFS